MKNRNFAKNRAKIAFILIFWLEISMQVIFHRSFVPAIHAKSKEKLRFSVNLLAELCVNKRRTLATSKDTPNYAKLHLRCMEASHTNLREKGDGDCMETIHYYITIPKQSHSFYPSSNRFELVCTWKSIHFVWCALTQNLMAMKTHLSILIKIENQHKVTDEIWREHSFSLNCVYFKRFSWKWCSFWAALVLESLGGFCRTDTFCWINLWHHKLISQLLWHKEQDMGLKNETEKT